MSTIGRILSRGPLYSMCNEVTHDGTTTTLRLNNARTLYFTPQRLVNLKKPAEENDQDNNNPIKFSTSKANQKTWKVDQSMGSKYQRPWWKVLPISLFGLGFLLWCTLRNETDLDEQLQKNLYEHLPGLLSDEKEEVESKSR